MNGSTTIAEKIGNVSASQTVLTAELLLAAFDQLPMAQFKDHWRNGTGYFDGAVFDAEPLNAITGSIDPESGTRIILVPVRRGILFFNVVFFIKGGRVCCNAPANLFRKDGRIEVYLENGEHAFTYKHRVVTGETFTYAGRWYNDGEYSHELYEYARMITDIAASA